MSQLFRGGIPIAPDVAKLTARYQTPAENALIAYDEIATLIGAAYGTGRFRGVVTAWRKMLDKPPYCRRLVAQSDQRAYRVLDGDGHVKHADRKIDLNIRGIKRQARSMINVEPSRLSSDGKLHRDHALLKAGSATAYRLRLSKQEQPQIAESNVSR